jgi:hypothetical protein
MNASANQLFRFFRCSPFASRLVGRTSVTAARSLTRASKRPFEVLGIQQIAIGSETRSGLDELWYKVLGLKQPANRVKLEKENVEEDIVSLGPHPFAVEIDLMTPIDPDKSPKVRVHGRRSSPVVDENKKRGSTAKAPSLFSFGLFQTTNYGD